MKPAVFAALAALALVGLALFLSTRPRQHQAPATVQAPAKAEQPLDPAAVACVASVLAGTAFTPHQAACFAMLFAALRPPGPAPGAAPAQPATLHMPASIGEVGAMLLGCYHPSGKLVSVEVQESPWRAQHEQWKARRSLLMVIKWRGGLLGTPYWTRVGLVERDGQVRALVQDEHSVLAAKAGCPLNNWVRLS